MLKTGKNGHKKKCRKSVGEKNPDSRDSFASREKNSYNFVNASYISVGCLTGA